MPRNIQNNNKVKKCRKCNNVLIPEINWYRNHVKNGRYICKTCHLKYKNIWRHKNGICGSLDRNKACSQYLGIHVAERVLVHVFKDVKKMPINNMGYDIICNRNKRIDVKSACMTKHGSNIGQWVFSIKQNKIADFFLCLAFDTREDLNPLYLWLIPCELINHLISTSISIPTINKWDKYRINIDKIVSCCNILKE